MKKIKKEIKKLENMESKGGREIKRIMIKMVVDRLNKRMRKIKEGKIEKLKRKNEEKWRLEKYKVDIEKRREELKENIERISEIGKERVIDDEKRNIIGEYEVMENEIRKKKKGIEKRRIGGK